MRTCSPNRLSLFDAALLTSRHLKAQNEVLDDINAQLRSYFSPLSRPASNLPFLYDMAAHQTDSSYFQAGCTLPLPMRGTGCTKKCIELPWQVEFQSEYDIHVNRRNPYYEYLSQPFTLNSRVLRGIYSRENSFTTITPFGNGNARFLYDINQNLNNVGIDIANPSTLANPPELVKGPLYICCQD